MVKLTTLLFIKGVYGHFNSVMLILSQDTEDLLHMRFEKIAIFCDVIQTGKNIPTPFEYTWLVLEVYSNPR